MCCIMTPEQFGFGHVGAPVPCDEIKLVDVPDAGYSSSNDPPAGEVWVSDPLFFFLPFESNNFIMCRQEF